MPQSRIPESATRAEFIIDGQPLELDISGSGGFGYGKAERLSTPATDATADQAWYEDGFHVYRFLGDEEFAALRDGVADCVRGIVARQGIDTGGFSLETYHRYVTTDEQHLAVVRLTRDLFPPDINFDVASIVGKLAKLMGHGLTDIYPGTDDRIHIIVRIIRPHRTDFNPPHKDVYEWDEQYVHPPMVNFWIPLVGVTGQSALPIAPRSHLIPEDRVYRTIEGGYIAGKRYRVRCVLNWDGSNELHRVEISEGEVLVFSPYLIHGCGVNLQGDATRVALEFRLFRTA
jgi:hypothetical protein